ncbi:AbrB family transcriptional regulator [Aquabacter sp. P-9]|uniref:AbrB family transcriptional regulator n=1 Tax=Aquabacter sediminis TaxID=3029197 RepID=UPI00237DC167|nr:AbrB family transcriptional regulator [Aquabacter sp. P-9]MDE1568036.1 AbrB family transcriptional regulator [Aquabacter sp. P-9]
MSEMELDGSPHGRAEDALPAADGAQLKSGAHPLRRRAGALLWLAVALALGSAGGWLAHLAHLPLAWLLGALFAAAGLAATGREIEVGISRHYALVILGLGLGQSFTAPVLAALAGTLPLLFACSALTMATGIFGARAYTRIAGLDPKTAFFCGVPGGVVLMAIHARSAGISESHVTLAQTVRLLVVVVLYPPLIASILPADAAALTQDAVMIQPSTLTTLVMWCCAGLGAAQIGKTIGLPNPWMLAPCVFAIALAALDALPAMLPDSLLVVGQIVLGVSLGARMTPAFFRGSGKLVLASLVSSLGLSALLLALGALVAYGSGLPMSATLLGMAPGGMPEMTVTAHALGASVPLVLGFHLVRVVLSNLLIEPTWKLARMLRLL